MHAAELGLFKTAAGDGNTVQLNLGFRMVLRQQWRLECVTLDDLDFFHVLSIFYVYSAYLV